MLEKILRDQNDLVNRFVNTIQLHENFAFVVGSACSMPPQQGLPGVPNVDGFVELARRQLKGTDAAKKLEDVLSGDSTDRYQAVIGCLQEERGEEGVDKLVREATYQSLQPEGARMPRYAIDENKAFRVPMDEVPECWWLPPAAKAIGQIIAENGYFVGSDVLTTNFDPLLEMAIANMGVPFARIALDEDGDLNAFGGTACRVIHLHGYWRATKTLHTPRQLQKARPRLRESLESLLYGRTVVVVGYGGWDDVFMRALTEVAMKPEADMRVMWLFYESDVVDLKRNNDHVLALLSPLLENEQAEVYYGIDAHQAMPMIAKSMSDKVGFLRLALKHYIHDAFEIESEEVKEWDESVRDLMPWREIVEEEFDTTRESLIKIKKGVIGNNPTVTPKRLANLWFENLLTEKYRFVPPHWRRNESGD